MLAPRPPRPARLFFQFMRRDQELRTDPQVELGHPSGSLPDFPRPHPRKQMGWIYKIDLHTGPFPYQINALRPASKFAHSREIVHGAFKAFSADRLTAKGYAQEGSDRDRPGGDLPPKAKDDRATQEKSCRLQYWKPGGPP